MHTWLYRCDCAHDCVCDSVCDCLYLCLLSIFSWSARKEDGKGGGLRLLRDVDNLLQSGYSQRDVLSTGGGGLRLVILGSTGINKGWHFVRALSCWTEGISLFSIGSRLTVTVNVTVSMFYLTPAKWKVFSVLPDSSKMEGVQCLTWLQQNGRYSVSSE